MENFNFLISNCLGSVSRIHYSYFGFNSLDVHDKLCGFQKAMFPLAIYGAQDTFSGRINLLRIWTTNNKPEIMGRFYYDYLSENRNKLIYNA
jgi:hypothetical protein